MKKLLIVVDFQNDFVSGALGFPGAEKLDDIICNKISDYKMHGYDVIYTFDTHKEDYMDTIEGHKLPIVHCVKGTVGHKLYGKVGSMFNEDDVYFEKETFPSLELANYLKDKDYREVELCGLVSNICVLSNVVMVKSALPNAVITVDRKATASFDNELNDVTFKVLNGIHIEVK